MPPKYKNLISTSTLYRADLNALDKEIKRMEEQAKANPFIPTSENIDLKKIEFEKQKMQYEYDMRKMEMDKEFKTINKNINT